VVKQCSGCCCCGGGGCYGSEGVAARRRAELVADWYAGPRVWPVPRV